MISKDTLKKSRAELLKLLEEKRKVVEKLVGEVYKGKEKNITKVRTMKKEVARIKTLLNQKNLEKEQNA